MKSQCYLPHRALSPYIQCFVYSCVGKLDEAGLQELDLFPVGYGLMAFILKEKHQIFNVVTNKNYDIRFNFTGQLDRYHRLVASSSDMVYVLFKPYGAYQLLGIPQHELKNESTSLFDLFGNRIYDLFIKMEDHANDHRVVIGILEEWLLLQLQSNHRLDISRVKFACDEIMLNRGNLSIKDLYSTCAMSKSSMEQYFRVQVGLSPKAYSRIIRFNHINNDLRKVASTSWMEIVDRYGYFDQAHFIHEFKYFFGYSPSLMHLSYQNLAQHITSVHR